VKQSELQSVVAAWKPAPKKRGKASTKSKSTTSRHESARKLAELSIGAEPDDALIDALEAAAGAYPDDKAISRALCRALSQAGRVGEAISELEERLQAHPEDTEDLEDVSELYERTQRTELAVDRLRRAVDQLVATGDLARAIPAAKRLIALQPLSL